MEGMTYPAVRMWSAFLLAHPAVVEEPAAARVTAWAFGAGPAMGTELAELVVNGTKRATASSLHALLTEGEAPPLTGDYSVILDGDNEARCVIKTTAVSVVPFNEVTAAFAAREGEGDGSLAFWRDAHRRAFGAEHAELSIPFDETVPVVCEEFTVVWPPEAVEAVHP